MQDKQIRSVLRITLQNFFVEQYNIVIEVETSYQPTTQGRSKNPTLYIYKLFDQRVGHVERKNTYRAETDDFLHSEHQQYESTFQVMALAPEKPADLSSYTASDYANMAATALQSDMGLTWMSQFGLRPLRITTVRNPYFENDSGQWEAMPSFDVVLTHHSITESTTPAVQSVKGKFDHGYKYQKIR